MKSILPILALTVSGLVPASVTAQSKAEEQAAAILVVARELREAGKSSVAATLEAQARRILAGAKGVKSARAGAVGPRAGAAVPGAVAAPPVRIPGSIAAVPSRDPANVTSAPRSTGFPRRTAGVSSVPRPTGFSGGAPGVSSVPRPTGFSGGAPGVTSVPRPTGFSGGAPGVTSVPRPTGFSGGAPGVSSVPRPTGFAGGAPGVTSARRPTGYPRGTATVNGMPRAAAPARGVATVPRPGTRSARNRKLFEYPRTGEFVEDASRDTLPSAGDARIDLGRERFRYQPVPTGKDAKGRVTWKGLPARDPRMDIRRPVNTVPDASGQSLLYPNPENLNYTRTRKPVVVPFPDVRGTRFDPATRSGGVRAGELETRVESLSAEVRAMRELLQRLSQQLEAERKAKKSKH